MRNIDGSAVDDGHAYLELFTGYTHRGEQVISGHYNGASPHGMGLGNYVYSNDSISTDRLLRIDNGLGLESQIAYRALSDDSASECPSPLYRTSGPVTGLNGQHLASTAMVVVSKVDVSDGVGGATQQCFQYENAWTNRLGRGFQAFQTIHATTQVPSDPANDLRTTEAFETRFPLAGKLKRRTITPAADATDAPPIFETSTVWTFECSSGLREGYCWTGPYSVVSVSRDLPASRVELGRKSIRYHYTGRDRTYGNPTRIRTTTTDASHMQTTTTEYFRDYDFVGDWWLDKVDSEKTTYGQVSSLAGLPVPSPSSNRAKSVTQQLDYFLTGANRRLLQRVELQKAFSRQNVAFEAMYDAYGNLVQLDTTSPGAANSNPRRDVFGYGSDGYFKSTERNTLNHLRTFEYDPRHGQLTRETDANGRTTTYIRDAFGDLLERRAPGEGAIHYRRELCSDPPSTVHGCPSGDTAREAVVHHLAWQAGGIAEHTFVDALKRPLLKASETMSWDFRLQWWAYDARGHLTHRLGPIVDTMPSQIDLPSLFNGKLIEVLDFDAMDRPARVLQTRSDFSNHAVLETRYQYDGLAKRIERPDGSVIVRTLDSRGRLVELSDPRQHKTKYRYDPTGPLALVEDDAGNQTRFEYDELGRITEIDEPNAASTHFTYDGFGQIISRRTPRGDVIDLIYDPLGRVVTTVVNGVIDGEWHYDRAFVGLWTPKFDPPPAGKTTAKATSTTATDGSFKSTSRWMVYRSGFSRSTIVASVI